jgi:hypothetical protein
MDTGDLVRLILCREGSLPGRFRYQRPCSNLPRALRLTTIQRGRGEVGRPEMGSEEGAPVP